MKRARIRLLIRATVLVAGLAAGYFFGIAPLWDRADAEKSEADRLKVDVERVDSGWARLASFHDLDAEMVLGDSLLTDLLAGPGDAVADLDPVTGAVPNLLSEITRLGELTGIAWTEVQARPAEPAAVLLNGGESLTAARVRLEVRGNGTYAAFGRAIRDMQTGSLLVAVRDVAMTAASQGTVDAHLTIDVYGAP